jgi:hypothetical protein
LERRREAKRCEESGLALQADRENSWRLLNWVLSVVGSVYFEEGRQCCDDAKLRSRSRSQGELESGRDFEKDRRKEKSKELCSREFGHVRDLPLRLICGLARCCRRT